MLLKSNYWGGGQREEQECNQPAGNESVRGRAFENFMTKNVNQHEMKSKLWEFIFWRVHPFFYDFTIKIGKSEKYHQKWQNSVCVHEWKEKYWRSWYFEKMSRRNPSNRHALSSWSKFSKYEEKLTKKLWYLRQKMTGKFLTDEQDWFYSSSNNGSNKFAANKYVKMKSNYTFANNSWYFRRFIRTFMRTNEDMFMREA